MQPIGVQLAQSQPAGTSAVAVPTRRKRKQITVTRIVVCNTTGASANYSLFHDDDGATFSAETALFYAVPLAGNTTDIIDLCAGAGGLVISTEGQIGVQTSTGSALTFSVYGIDGVQA
jgi:hypothetical protein